MRYSRLVLKTAILSGIAISGSVIATEEQLDLPELTVTAVRGLERGGDSLPLSVSVISRDDLDRLPGRTLDEVLRQVVGVQLPLNNSTTSFPANPGIAIRGVGLGDNGTRTLVLLDGRPMNGAFFGNVFWNRIPLNNVERIEIVRGSSSSQFGSLAIGGVVNIITRPLSDRPSANVTVRGGNDDTVQGSAFASTALTEDLRIAVDVNHFDTDGYFLTRQSDRAPIDTRAHSEVSNFGIRAEYALTESTLLHARSAYYSQDQQGSTALSRTDTRIYDVSAGLETRFDDGTALMINVHYLDEKYSNDGTSLTVFGSRDEEFVSNTHRTLSDEFGGSLLLTHPGSGWLAHWTLGVDYRDIEGDDDQDIFLNNGNLFLNQLAGGEQQFIGAFVETSIRPTAALEILPSVRFDHVNNSSGVIAADDVVTQFDGNDIDRINARVALRYALNDEWALRGAYYRGFRAPTLAELYRRFGTSTFVGQSNPELDEETSTGGEVGIDFTQDGWKTQLNAFQTTVKNQIGGVVIGFAPFTLLNQNIGRIRSRGLEVISELQINEQWHFDVGYTYTDAEIRSNIDEPELTGNHVEGAPEHFATVGLNFRSGGVNAQVRGRYSSEQFQDASNETRVPEVVVFDAYAAYRFSAAWEVFANVENLFDNTYTASAFGGLRRTGAPRQFVLGLNWRL